MGKGRPQAGDRGARTMSIGCKVSPDEYKALAAWAAANGCTVGELLRAAALAGLELADEQRTPEEVADVPRLPGLATVGPQMGPLRA